MTQNSLRLPHSNFEWACCLHFSIILDPYVDNSYVFQQWFVWNSLTEAFFFFVCLLFWKSSVEIWRKMWQEIPLAISRSFSSLCYRCVDEINLGQMICAALAESFETYISLYVRLANYSLTVNFDSFVFHGFLGLQRRKPNSWFG